jgi:uncharacterized protein (UPF0147 family)
MIEEFEKYKKEKDVFSLLSLLSKLYQQELKVEIFKEALNIAKDKEIDPSTLSLLLKNFQSFPEEIKNNFIYSVLEIVKRNVERYVKGGEYEIVRNLLEDKKLPKNLKNEIEKNFIECVENFFNKLVKSIEEEYIEEDLEKSEERKIFRGDIEKLFTDQKRKIRDEKREIEILNKVVDGIEKILNDEKIPDKVKNEGIEKILKSCIKNGKFRIIRSLNRMIGNLENEEIEAIKNYIEKYKRENYYRLEEIIFDLGIPKNLRNLATKIYVEKASPSNLLLIIYDELVDQNLRILAGKKYVDYYTKLKPFRVVRKILLSEAPIPKEVRKYVLERIEERPIDTISAILDSGDYIALKRLAKISKKIGEYASDWNYYARKCIEIIKKYVNPKNSSFYIKQLKEILEDNVSDEIKKESLSMIYRISRDFGYVEELLKIIENENNEIKKLAERDLNEAILNLISKGFYTFSKENLKRIEEISKDERIRRDIRIFIRVLLYEIKDFAY